MATESYDIVGSFNDQRITSLDGDRSINLFEYVDAKTKKNKSLISTSGLDNTNFNFLGATGRFRAQFVFKDQMFFVIGSSVLRLNLGGAISLLGTLTSTTVGYVGIDANTFQVIFVDGANGYIYDNTAGTFLKITDAAFPPVPIDVCNLDGFFVVAHGGTNQFQLSSFNQGLVWGPDFTTLTGNAFLATSGSSPNLVLSTGTTLNYQVGTPVTFNNTGGGTFPVGSTLLVAGTIYFVQSVVNATTFTISATNGGAAITFTTTGTAPIFVTNGGQLQQGTITTHPGNIVACRTLHRRLFLFSEFFTEVWENAGIGTNLPFRRNNTLLMEYGTPAIGSISVSFDMMFFLSQSRDGLGAVMEVQGTQSMPVSNKALDFKLAQYASVQHVADCRAFLIKENGIIFYRLNFTLANHTYVYNVTLSEPENEQGRLWHEEETIKLNRHPAETHAYFNGFNYVGHYLLPIMYIVNVNSFTNDGEAIPRRRIGKPILPGEYQRTRIDRFQLDLLQGSVLFLHSAETLVSLLAEDGLEIDTESGDSILLDQAISNVQAAIQPRVFLQYSKDGGQTFGNQLIGTMGAVGERKFRTVWRKLGVVPRGQAFVPKIEFFNNGPFQVLGAAWSFDVLPE